MGKRSFQVNLLEGSILKSVILFAVPVLLSGVLQLLFNAADIIVVGNFASSHEMGAVGATSSLANLLIALGIGLSIGANVLVAQRIGERNTEGVHRAVHTSMSVSVLAGLVLGVVGFLFSEKLLGLLGTPSDIIDSSAAYLRAYCAGIPFNIVYNFGSAILRASGDTKRPLYFLSIAGVANVILNLIFVIVFHMGAVGVGLATAISQVISAILVVLCLLSEDSIIKLSVKKMRFYKAETLRVIAVGFPAGLQSSLFSISNMLIQSSINSFGADAVAGNAAASNLEGFIYIAMNAMYQTILTFTAQNRGAGQYKRINRGLASCLGCVLVVGLFLGGMMQLFDHALLSMYTQDEKAIAYGLIRIPFFALPYFLCGMMDTIMGAVRGLGYSFMPLITSLFGACFFRIIWVYTVFAQNRTLETLYISYPISWLLTAAIHFICFMFAKKRAFKKQNLQN